MRCVYFFIAVGANEDLWKIVFFALLTRNAVYGVEEIIAFLLNVPVVAHGRSSYFFFTNGCPSFFCSEADELFRSFLFRASRHRVALFA